MKKIISFMIMLLLILSTISVVARERDPDSDSGDRLGRKFINEDVRRVNERLERIPEALRELRNANRDEIRSLVNREDFNKIGLRLKECKSEEEACKELRREAKLKAKNTLKNITERILNVLSKLKERIESSGIENKEGALNEINVAIEKINAAKEKVIALTNESTKDEVRAAISGLREALKDAKELIRKYHSKTITEQRLRNAINRFTKLAQNIENRLNRFEVRDYDFSDLKALLVDLRKELDNAKTDLDAGNKESSLGYLKNAHQITLSILRQFRAGIGEKPEDKEGNETEGGSEDE